VETGFILRRADVVRAPDASFVAAARIPKAGMPDAYWPFAPDLAVEVVSPSDSPADVDGRVGDYFAAGTRRLDRRSRGASRPRASIVAGRAGGRRGRRADRR